MPRKQKIAGDENSCQENATSWFDIPLEMREMVTNKMDIRTRCKLLQCSKKCEDEVKTSERFLANIKISRSNNPELHIGLGKSWNYHYCLEFIDVSNLSEPQVIVVYKTVPFSGSKEECGNEKKEIKWMKTENGRAEEIRMRYLKEFIGKYWKTIGNIEIDDYKFMESNCGMKQLPNLKHFTNSTYDVREKEWLDLSQIKKFESCTLTKTEFTFEEVLEFEGSSYTIRLDDLNEEKLEKYLKMFKNGEIHRNMTFFCAYFETSQTVENAKCRRIAKNLNAFDFSGENDSCHFRFLPNYERGFECCFEVYLDSDSFSICIQFCSKEYVRERSQPIID